MSTNDVILSNDCMTKSPVGKGEQQSNNICEKKYKRSLRHEILQI